MDGKDDAKVAEAAAGVEKLSLSKKKKFKFVKVDPKELNIVIDDGRGRDTDFRNNNKPNHVKSQDSRKSSSHHADKGSGGSSRHAGSSGGGATSRNMSRGSSKHTPASSNYKADFEVNEESSLQHNKKQKRDSSKINPSAISQQASNDKEFKNNLMWDGETAKKSRNQWKNLEVNNITNKARERITKHVSSNDSLPSEGEVDSRTTTAPILDSSLYQNTYDSKTRNFVDSGSQLFNTASSLTDAPTEHVNREDKLFSNEALYAPTSYTSSSAPTYAAMTTASANSTNAGSNSNASGVYSTNSFIAATTHGYSSISNTITNTQPAQQQNNNSVYSSNINTYSTFPQQNSSVNMNSYGQEDSSLSSNNTTGYSSQSLYQQQPSSVSYTSNSYVYPQTSISSSSNLSSTSHKYPPYGVDIKNHLDSKSTMESKSSVEHPSYMDYSNYMTSQYQDSLLKDIKTTADTLAHFEFRNPLEITPIIPVDNYIPNYIQPGPPPQSNSEYKMLYSQYWNNVPMTNILHPPPPQPPHSTMYKYTPHMPYDIQPTSQAAQKPFMKMNESTAGSDSSAYMRLHHRYPLDNTTTNKMPLAYTEPQPPNLQSSLSEYQRHHFTDFGNFQTPPLGSLMQHNYQTNDTFGSTDLPTRIHQPPTSVHPYFNNTEDSAAQRYGLADSGLHARNKRAITGGTNQPQHFNSRSPHYQHTPGYPRHTGYEDKDLSKPPVPHTSGNIFVNHNKYEPHFPPPTPTPTTVLPPAAPEKLRKPTTNPSPTVVTSIITSTANTHVTTAPPIGAKPAETLEKPPTETFKKEPEDNAISGKKTSKPVHQSPAKTNNTTQQPNERGQQKLGGERSRDRGDNGRAQQHQNNMIKTIDFHQFQNNVMKNHPGNGKGFRSFNNKTYGDNKNKNEFKVTKIMQRPVDENKEEIAKLPISLGGEKLEETKNGKKVDDENKSKDSKNTKSANNGANKKTSKQQNIQILSPAKKTTKDESKVEKENKDSKQTDEKSKSSEDKENKSDDKTKESKISDSKDIARPNKREEGIRENKQQQQQQQRRKFNYNYNPKYVRHPYHNNMGDFQYVPMFDGSMNKFNKFNGGGHNRYPHPRYYDFDIDPRDPRMCLYTGGPGPYAQYGGSGGAPPMYNNLYNSNNYNNHKNKYKNELSKPSTVDKKQGSVNAEEKKAKTSQKQKSEDESKKTSNKKIKFKGTEILNESSSPSSSAVHSNALTAAPSTTPDNSSNPSSILKKSKTNEDCKDKLVQETTKSEKNQKKKVVDLDEREPSTIQLFMGLGLDRTPTKKPPLVYPLHTFDMDIGDMTSREMFEDVYADVRTHQITYQDKQLVSCFFNSIVNESHLFQDKIVLEVGCGMGQLSLFCAEAGAKHVISVDCSVITQLTQEIVEENKLDDVITVIQSRMEDIVRLPHGIKQVDIIVSNWMGHSLYLDSIVNAVLFARDRFLRPGGLILPDRAELYCAVANDSISTAKHAFWYDVYGFSMEPIQRDWPNVAKFHTVPSDQVMSDSVLVHSIDLNTCKVSDTNFNLEFTLEANKTGFVNSFVLYFKTYFLDATYILDTSPLLPSTHWGQTVLFIDRTMRLHAGARLLCNLHYIRLRDKQNSVQCNLSLDFLGYPDSFFEKKYILSFY